jgi:signal transduction histidine kinase
VIAGDVDAGDVRPLAERTFGEVAPQPAIPVKRLRPQEPTPAGPRTVTLSDPRVEQTSVRRYYLVPSAATAAAGESPALDVLAQLMGGGSNSYLYRALVIDRPLAVSAGAGYQGTSLDPTQFMISASPKPGVEFAQIEQVILNLVANGLDAVERGGTLRIRLQEQTDHLALEFADDGCGMTPDTIENLFEPFFTRKQSGQGTGLGLSISHRIINQHGGTISASSPGPGLGSTFAVRLPRNAASQAAAAA